MLNGEIAMPLLGVKLGGPGRSAEYGADNCEGLWGYPTQIGADVLEI